MVFKRFENEHIEEAADLAMKQYQEECLLVEGLPRALPKDIWTTLLSGMVKNQLGIAAFEGTKMVGYITAYGPTPEYFGRSTGVFVPIHGHGAIKEGREKIYSRMYTEIADRWINRGIGSHVISCYAHDEQVLQRFFHLGFGMRCVDGVTSLQNVQNETTKFKESSLKIREIPIKELGKIVDLEQALGRHMGTSPIFMASKELDLDTFKKRSLARESRFFGITKEGQCIAYMEVGKGGENFTTNLSHTKNILGAYCMPTYRGQGYYLALLQHVKEQLREEGYKSLGVDYESINPIADSFWGKYFNSYTYSLARRVDERVLIC